MIIDLSGGSFDATNDFEVELGAGSGDRVVINGTGSADAFVFGLDGINLDGDGNADVTDKTAVISPNVPTEGRGFRRECRRRELQRSRGWRVRYGWSVEGDPSRLAVSLGT